MTKNSSSERLLFVQCNGPTGRPSRNVRPLLSRHVMGNHLTANSYHSGEVIFEDEKLTVKNRPAIGVPRRTPKAHRKAKSLKTTKDPHVVTEPYPSTDTALSRPSGPAWPYVSPMRRTLNTTGHLRQEEVARWWFYHGESISAPLRIGQYHWATAAWDIARQSDFTLECVKLYAWRKRAQLTGNADRYMAQQLLLIRRIKDSVVQHGEHLESEPFALVAVSILAHVALLDADLKTSATHLHALRAFDLARHFEHSKQQWLYMVWVDFRFSLIKAIPPVLDYFIPLVFRDALRDLSTEHKEMLQHARSNSALSPCSTLFDEVEMHVIFLKLHQLFYACAASQDSQFSIYGLLYDLEYRLRVIHAGLRQFVQKDTITTNDEAVRLNVSVEMILISIQLHVWVACRCWAPVSSHTRQTVCRRAYDLFCHASAPEIVTTWKSVGDIRSLVWCLFTIAAFSMETSENDVAPLIKTLRYTLDSLGLFTREELSELLREWFWDDNWHLYKVELVWSALEERDIRDLCTGLDRLQMQIGAVEFYNA